jgi:hypothetical protein
MTPAELKALRLSRGETLAAFGAHFDVSRQFVWEVERGGSPIPKGLRDAILALPPLPSIRWIAGPPPSEWRDGRDVLVWDGGCMVIRGWYAQESGPDFDMDGVTHHAAINAPEAT